MESQDSLRTRGEGEGGGGGGGEGEVVERKELRVAEQLLRQQVLVQTKSAGMIGNLVAVIWSKTYQLYLNILGDYNYQPKNQFSYSQKIKILSYLQSKVLTVNSQFSELSPIKFTAYNPNFLTHLPPTFQALRNKIMKGQTNLDAARESLERMRRSDEYLRIKYLNEQAFQFEQMKINSVIWGLFFGACINATLYRNGNAIRKAALFITSGQLLAMFSHRLNMNRYFDSVYPLFKEEAVEYVKREKEEFKGWRPEGKADIQQ